MNVIYILLLALFILVAMIAVSYLPTNVIGSSEPLPLKDAYKRYLTVLELENFTNTFENRNQYELHNILERYLLTAYPDLTSKKASKHMIKQLKEKHLPVTIHDQVQEIISKDMVTKPQKASYKVIGDKVLLTYGKFKFTLPKYRFDILSKRGSLEEIILCALEVSSLMPASQQWGIPLSEYRKYVAEGATIEGFASPFNSQIMRLTEEPCSSKSDLAFCSLSKSDTPFGSLGNFFDQDFEGRTVIVNPPFIESLLKKAARKCISELEEHPCKFIFYGPNWADSPFYDILEKSKYKVSKTVLPKFKHNYEDLMRGKNIKATFNSVVFVLERV